MLIPWFATCWRQAVAAMALVVSTGAKGRLLSNWGRQGMDRGKKKGWNEYFWLEFISTLIYIMPWAKLVDLDLLLCHVLKTNFQLEWNAYSWHLPFGQLLTRWYPDEWASLKVKVTFSVAETHLNCRQQPSTNCQFATNRVWKWGTSLSGPDP